MLWRIGILIFVVLSGCSTKKPIIFINPMGDGPGDAPVHYHSLFACHDESFTGKCPNELSVRAYYEEL